MRFLLISAPLFWLSCAINGGPLVDYPSAKALGATQRVPSVQHLTLNGNTIEAWPQPFVNIGRQQNPSVFLPIPNVLHLTSKERKIEEVDPAILSNVRKELARNPNFQVKYWGDDACHDYLQTFYSDALLYAFDHAGRDAYGGAYRGDICRAAVLNREGGFYMDLDVELNRPLLDLIDNTTTFMAVRHSNMLMAVAAQHPIMHDTLEQIIPWYQEHDSGKANGLMGPATIEKGFAASCQCGMNCNPDKLTFKCGLHEVRLYKEVKVPCDVPTVQCPLERVNAIKTLRQFGKNALHLRYAIQTPHHEQTIGWNRFTACEKYGCGGNGYEDKDWSDMSQDANVANTGIFGRFFPSPFVR